MSDEQIIINYFCNAFDDRSDNGYKKLSPITVMLMTGVADTPTICHDLADRGYLTRLGKGYYVFNPKGEPHASCDA